MWGPINVLVNSDFFCVLGLIMGIANTITIMNGVNGTENGNLNYFVHCVNRLHKV